MTEENQAAQEAAATPKTTPHDESIIVVKNYTMSSLAPAMFPFPLVDLAALSAIQLKMLHSLSELYQVEFSNEMGKAAITSLVSSVFPVAITPLLASMVKIIPGLGQAAGVASMLVLGGAATHALGMVFIRHFEAGGDFSNFEAQVAADYFKEEFEKGKQIAMELKDYAEKQIQAHKTTSPATPPAEETGDRH